MTEYYLWLQQVMDAANPRSIQLLKHFGDAESVYREVEKGNKGFLKNSELKSLKSASLDNSEKIMEFCKNSGYGIVTYFDDSYPELLRGIYNPPLLLFTDGDISCLNDEICITIIGTRNPSEYSIQVTETISRKLAELGIVIVSGFAVGIDKTAQSAALNIGGKTAGVLACGIDVDYPRGSVAFRKKVAACGGVAVSELFPGTPTKRGYFHLRNRIMSGLSSGTLITEAGQSSGCHITAGYAVSQNRDLFCIPPANIFQERYSGVVRYLRDGAISVFSYIDIVQQYKTGLELKIYENENFRKESETPEYYGTEKTPKTTLHASLGVMPETPPAPDVSALTSTQAKLFGLLKGGAQTLDYLIRESGFAPNEISDNLLDMELDGIVESIPGAQYKICGV